MDNIQELRMILGDRKLECLVLEDGTVRAHYPLFSVTGFSAEDMTGSQMRNESNLNPLQHARVVVGALRTYAMYFSNVERGAGTGNPDNPALRHATRVAFRIGLDAIREEWLQFSAMVVETLGEAIERGDEL